MNQWRLITHNGKDDQTECLIPELKRPVNGFPLEEGSTINWGRLLCTEMESCENQWILVQSPTPRGVG